jgi:hypothetical protein
MAKTLKLPNAAFPADLDSLAAVVLANLPSCTDDQRDGLSAGTHAVDLDVRLRIRGELAVSISTMTTQVNLLPWQEMAMLLANKLPQAVVDEVITEGIVIAKRGRESVQAEALKAEAENLKGRVEAAFEQAALTIQKPRKGGVKLKGDIEVTVKDRG